MCITNGRVTPEFNNMTSVSAKGKAVVDFIVMPTDTIGTCLSCHVHQISDIINENNLHGLLRTKNKLLGHSLIVIRTEETHFCQQMAILFKNVINSEIPANFFT